MVIKRRTLLGSAGFAGAATLVACRPETADGQSSGGSHSGKDAYSSLADTLDGTLVTPNSSKYASAARVFNPIYDGRKPAAVAQCASTADVRACVRAAASSKGTIAARAGGHSYAGYSVPDDALVADVSKLSDVRVHSDGSAVIGAGAQLMDVYKTLARSGRALPGGSCPSVGIAGLTLGGGVGVLTRTYGLTCDLLTSAKIVTADGKLRTASKHSNPDLFWALRGGGGGNFGIVTSLTFDTVRAQPLTVFTVSFGKDSAEKVLTGWQNWLPTAPEKLWTKCTVSGGPSPSGSLAGCYVGRESDLTPLLNQLVKEIGLNPSNKVVSTKDFLPAMRFYAGGGDGARESFVGSSRIQTKKIRKPGKVVSLAQDRSGLDIMFDALGGAVSRIADDATAFPYRSALSTVQVYQTTTPAKRSEANKTVAAVRDGLADLVGNAAYVNYIDPKLPDWGQAYYGDNLSKLQQVARDYDPHQLFSFPQSLHKA